MSSLDRQSWLVFVSCAAISAFAATVAATSGGLSERWYGTMLAVFCGLAAIVAPLLMELQRRK